MAARQNNDLLDKPNAANVKNAELEQQLYNYAQHMAMVQQSAVQYNSLFEQQRTQLQCEIVRMQCDMNNMGRQRSSSNILDSAASETSERIPMIRVRKNIMTTPVAS